MDDASPRLTKRELARLRWSAFFQWHRVLGISALSLAAYFLVVIVFGKIDISWLVPPALHHFHWPDLPAFFVEKSSPKDGQNGETFYTVPTRQITPQELAQMGKTNQTVAPASGK